MSISTHPHSQNFFQRFSYHINPNLKTEANLTRIPSRVAQNTSNPHLNSFRIRIGMRIARLKRQSNNESKGLFPPRPLIPASHCVSSHIFLLVVHVVCLALVTLTLSSGLSRSHPATLSSCLLSVTPTCHTVASATPVCHTSSRYPFLADLALYTIFLTCLRLASFYVRS